MSHLKRLGWHWRIRVKAGMWVYPQRGCGFRLGSVAIPPRQVQLWQSVRVGQDRFGPVHLVIAHPERDMKRNTEGAGGVGTTPDGRSYYGYGWFQETVKDSVFFGGVGVSADFYDTQETFPPDIAKLIEEKEAIKAILYPPAK